MEVLLEFARNVYYKAINLKDDPETNYNTIFKEYNDFTKTYPLVVKYMCTHKVFDQKLFVDLLKTQQQTRPTYEQSYKLQADYVKQVLIKLKYNKMEAKKISNQELDRILTEVKKIKKLEENIKKNTKKINAENISEIRKETLEFVLDI